MRPVGDVDRKGAVRRMPRAVVVMALLGRPPPTLDTENPLYPQAFCNNFILRAGRTDPGRGPPYVTATRPRRITSTPLDGGVGHTPHRR